MFVHTTTQESKARLQRQVTNLRKAEEECRASLTRSEAARSEQERRLEAASSPVCVCVCWMVVHMKGNGTYTHRSQINFTESWCRKRSRSSFELIMCSQALLTCLFVCLKQVAAMSCPLCTHACGCSLSAYSLCLVLACMCLCLSQVAAMRGELSSLHTRLAARDEQLLKHVRVSQGMSHCLFYLMKRLDP